MGHSCVVQQRQRRSSNDDQRQETAGKDLWLGPLVVVDHENEEKEDSWRN